MQTSATASILVFPFNEIRFEDRLQSFIEWGSPNGTAGINHIHTSNFELSTPYFEFSSEFVPHSHNSLRLWLHKYEHMDKSFRFKPNQTKVERNNFIASGNFLSFAKSYINVITYYRNVRSKPKSLGYALIILEKAMRDIHGTSDNLNVLNLLTFKRAENILLESEYCQSVIYDTGKELEYMAGMLQTGYQNRAFKYANKGLRVISFPFKFVSSISNRQRKKHLNSNEMIDITNNNTSRISNEELAAVGLAYSKSLKINGPMHMVTYLAAICGLSFITLSMRLSEVLILKRDAVYLDEDTQRLRMRVFRPKINDAQNLPIPHKLESLAQEIFQCILNYSLPAHDAFSFYIGKFPTDFSLVNELFIPDQYKPYFEKEFLTINELYSILELETPKLPYLPKRFSNLATYKFCEIEDDLYNPRTEIVNPKIRSVDYISTVKLKELSKLYNFKFYFPTNIGDKKFLKCKDVMSHILVGDSNKRSIRKVIYQNSTTPLLHIKSKDLAEHLLNEFKKNSFPHWPYNSKDKVTKLNEALLVNFQNTNNVHIKMKDRAYEWWRPIPLTGNTINLWLSQYAKGPAHLFRILDIKLSNGAYPSVTMHKARKYHQTEALLAGAHEVFIDELAGRKTGRQSEHYDLRTPHEIITQSIETFDPSLDFEVIGPITKEIPIHYNQAERRVFLYENAAPKHMTEVGGCRSDWSIDPCEMFGDCMRCDKSVWQKGDLKRLGIIREMRDYSLKMIEVANKKIAQGNSKTSILKHLQQFKDTLNRCKEILSIECDSTIKIGTIVTFSAAQSSFSNSQLINKLKAENCKCEKV